MYYKTKRDSETGAKFTAMEKRRDEAYTAARELIIKLGANEWRSTAGCIWGGIGGFTFTGATPHWARKNKHGFYVPNLRKREGAVVAYNISQLPTVTRAEFNACIGYKEKLNKIGATFSNPDYFLLEIDEEWNITMPQDCEEITVGEYKVLSSIKVESNN